MLKAFKGFNKDLKCRDMQYEIGKTFEIEGTPKCCRNGLHACEYPLSVFNYYSPNDSRYCEVEADGIIDKDSDDSKIAASKLTIGAEIGIKGLIDAAIKFTFEKADWSKKEDHATGTRGAASATGTRGAASATGDQGAASATGYQGAASATGYQGAASATGDQGAASATGDQGAASATGTRGAASVEGKESIASALGIEGKAKGIIGSWLVIAEWEFSYDDAEWHIKKVKTVKVDGKKIKADTWYTLTNGLFVEVTEE